MSIDRRSLSVMQHLVPYAASISLCSPVMAQDLGGALDLGQLGASIGVNRAIGANVARSQGSSRSAPPPYSFSPDTAPAQTEAAPVRLTFTPSVERRRKNLAQFVAKSRDKDPQGAAKMEKVFASRDVIEHINGQIGTYGLQANNVADAYTLWWLSAWFASRGRTDDPSRQQIQAVRAQAVQAMSSLPAMVKADDAVKQEMTEAYLLQSDLIAAYLAQARNDPDLMQRMGDAVRQGAQASGLDLDAIELTDDGFVPAG